MRQANATTHDQSSTENIWQGRHGWIPRELRWRSSELDQIQSCAKESRGRLRLDRTVILILVVWCKERIGCQWVKLFSVKYGYPHHSSASSASSIPLQRYDDAVDDAHAEFHRCKKAHTYHIGCRFTMGISVIKGSKFMSLGLASLNYFGILIISNCVFADEVLDVWMIDDKKYDTRDLPVERGMKGDVLLTHTTYNPVLEF